MAEDLAQQRTDEIGGLDDSDDARFTAGLPEAVAKAHEIVWHHTQRLNGGEKRALSGVPSLVRQQEEAAAKTGGAETDDVIASRKEVARAMRRPPFDEAKARFVGGLLEDLMRQTKEALTDRTDAGTPEEEKA